MFTIIVGTNRKGSKSALIAELIRETLQSKNEQAQILSMAQVPVNLIREDMFSPQNQHPIIAELQDKYVTPAQKLIFVIPEYNGSFPGILKLFIDAVSVRNYKTNFKNKKSLIIGLASGRLGNAIGASHLNTILNYMGMHTYPEKMYISGVDGKFKDDVFVNTAEIDILSQLLKDFINY